MAKRKDSKGRVLKTNEYQRANGTYEYKWVDHNGKRHSLYAKSLEELREQELELLKNVMEGIKQDRKSITVSKLYELWLSVKRGLKDNTLESYKYFYYSFIEPRLGNRKVSDLKRSDIRGFYNYLHEVRGLKTASIDNVHTVLHQLLDLAVQDDYIRYNPSDNALSELKRAVGKDEKKKALTVLEQDLFENFLLSHPEYRQWYPVFVLMLWSGLRVGETTGLRWDDIDFKTGFISVNHTLVYYAKGKRPKERKSRFAINTPKTDAGKRSVPLLPKVQEALLMLKEIQKEAGITCKSEIDGYTNFVFLNRFGNVHNQNSLNRAIHRIIRDCNFEVLDKSKGSKKDPVLLPNFSCHSLRHTFTTRMCEAGVNIKVMQVVLGHADADTTLNVYAEATKEFRQSELTSFAEYFRERGKKAGNE